ncbi:MAG: hypothetical protein AAFZ52_15870, partial [Bacteroidota bacterium]
SFGATFRIAFFSQMALPEPVLDCLRQLVAWTETEPAYTGCEILLLGGSEDKVRRTAAQLRESGTTATIQPIGYLPAVELSSYLWATDLAISPVPVHALGKSGTVAAFLRHGLAVAAPVHMHPDPSFFAPELNAAILTEFSPESIRIARAAARNLNSDIISVESIARQMRQALFPTSAHKLPKILSQ